MGTYNSVSKHTLRVESYGGPWASSSIEAAAIWSFQSKLLINALGCSACQQPGQPYRQRTGAIAINRAAVPSRFGGWQWMSRKED